MTDREANIKEQIQLATELVAAGDRCESCDAQICGQCEGTDSDALRLAELVLALNKPAI